MFSSDRSSTATPRAQHDGRTTAAGPAPDRVSPLGLAAAGFAGAGFVAVAIAWGAGGGTVDLPWAPALGLRLHLRLDGLGALYSLLATGIGCAVFLYAARYLRRHLAHDGRPARDERVFYAHMLLFMVAMVGLATAQDLILAFVFWDLTAIASYFLIGFDRRKPDAWGGALMALLVTGVTAVFLLIGAVMLFVEYGTFQLPDLIARAEPGPVLTVAAGLMALAALAKSAQVPLHFWLPRAMAAPTPVSAYLHSAAMVAAGVLLLGRTYPLIEQSRLLLDALLAIGFASIVVGGVLALTRDPLKQVLAYSTISQYGYVVALYGLGGATAAVAAAFYVIAHAIAKSTLFLTAGAVTDVTGGEDRLSCLGGLRRQMPATAVAGGVAALALAALPLTVGFFKDELLFKAALERGPVFALLAAGAAALTVAYILRFWTGVFIGTTVDGQPVEAREPRRAGLVRDPLPATMLVPLAALALVAIGFGIAPGPLERLAGAAGSVSVGAAVGESVAYHLDLRAENLLALAAYAVGAAIVATRRFWAVPAQRLALLGMLAGPERIYISSLRRLNHLSDTVHHFEVRDLRTRVAAVLVPCGLLVAIGFAATLDARAYRVGGIGTDDLAVVLPLVVAGLAAVAATAPRSHLTLVLVLSAAGFSLAVVYAFLGAPDVALVAVLVETLFALLFMSVFSLMPRATLRREAARHEPRGRRIRDAAIGVISGLFAFVVVWDALSGGAPAEDRVSGELLRLAPVAHAKDAVTAVLSDFRGLDTLGEITVVGVALAAVLGLVASRRTA